MRVSDIIERLKEFYKLANNQDLAEMLNISPSTLSSWKKRNSMDYSVLDKLPNIDLHWLITGQSFKGEIIKAAKTEYISSIDFTKATQSKSYLPVVLISEKVQAGYLSGFSDEIIEELPIMQFGEYRNGHQYRFFEIAGDSMEHTLLAGDYVLCELENSEHPLREGNIYVLHTKEGFVCKRVEKAKYKSIDFTFRQPKISG